MRRPLRSQAPALVLASLAAIAACAPPAPQIIYVLPGGASSAGVGVRELPPEPVPDDDPAEGLVMNQSSPREALRSFLRAFEAHRYDLLLRFVPDASRGNGAEELTEAKLRAAWEGTERATMNANVAAIRKAVLAGIPINIDDARASMPYGVSDTVQLVRENGAWKILDL